ncbi:hypothetical protein [Deinococcus alpinitundrae]|uniref:hypothetical protein n=1 Tax=Deinococcus alpinitundrae TaxID=468913 RepID=UPI001379E2BB|nr:hypothetical protein [Deinococcus alpinitundrae]
MRFVRKPKPYTSGLLGGLNWPPFQRRAQNGPRRHPPLLNPSPFKSPSSRSLGQTAPRLHPPAPPGRAARPAASRVQLALSLLAVLGVLVVGVIGGSAAFNQLNRESQFTAAASHLADLPR